MRFTHLPGLPLRAPALARAGAPIITVVDKARTLGVQRVGTVNRATGERLVTPGR